MKKDNRVLLEAIEEAIKSYYRLGERRGRDKVVKDEKAQIHYIKPDEAEKNLIKSKQKAELAFEKVRNMLR